MGADGALRSTGGSARVEDERRLVLVDGDVGERDVSGTAENVGKCSEAGIGSDLGDRLGGDIDEQDVLDRGELGEVGDDPVDATPIGDEDLGPRVLEPLEDLVGLPPAVEPHEHRAERALGPKGEAPPGCVGRHHRGY